MAKKSLILLVDNYPYGSGEFFLDDEINVLSQYFERIHVFSPGDSSQENRSIPSNVKIIKTSAINRVLYWAGFLRSIFFIPLWTDFFSVRHFFKINPSWNIFKILVADYIKAYQLKKDIQRYLIDHSISNSDCIFYSYWHDYKAVALAMLNNSGQMKAVVRAHGWDVDYPRHAIPYLSFKQYIVSNTTKSICISEYGKNRLQEIISSSEASKIEVLKLGKANSRSCVMEKDTMNQIHICSCSSLIPLKRVDLIIKLLSHLPFESIRWTHFGDGPLKSSLLTMAQSKLPHCTIDFKGTVPNEAILDFYHSHYIDLFVNMSSSEGIAVSIMEAQSAGIPVLATSVGGTPEIVNSENGFLVENDFDTRACALQIAEYLKSSASEIASKRNASYQNWKENFDAEKNYHTFAKMILAL